MKARLGFAFAVLILICTGGCSPGEPPESEPQIPTASTIEEERDLFVDVAKEVGLDFHYVNGQTDELYMHEIMGAGCALFDYDNDGDLDAYLIQGHPLNPDYDPERALEATGLDAMAHDRLYRNDLEIRPDGARVLLFTDVTKASGLTGIEYGMGIATGDFDNDGWVDLYVTNAGPNRFWRNNGDGTFSDITIAAGTGDLDWSTAATFVDIDHDGWLDLYVANYVHYGLFNHRPCSHPSSAPEYCGPRTYPAVADRLFRNNRDGTFLDVSAESGIAMKAAPGLGVVSGDFTGDGLTDLYVGNDSFDNMLWVNKGDGTFEDEALLAGCAVNSSGEREASMGLDAGDLDGDGDLDLIVGHMDGETNTLYSNLGGGVFEDRSQAAGLAQSTRLHTTYAPVIFDADADGWFDIFVTNGAMQIFNRWKHSSRGNPLVEPNQLFRNLGDGAFSDLGPSAGRVVSFSEVSRGAAVGDVDNDGDSDVLVTNNDGATRLMINSTENDSAWFGFDAVGGDGSTALGATAIFTLADGRQLLYRVATDGSYCSARDPRVAVSAKVVGEQPSVIVTWPDGSSERFPLTEPGGYTSLVKSTGSSAPNED